MKTRANRVIELKSVIPGAIALAVLTHWAAPAPATAQSGHDAVLAHVEANAADYAAVAQQIWELAEVGYQETESSALLQEQLVRAGFEIEAGVAGMPTAFVASWGDGVARDRGAGRIRRPARHHAVAQPLPGSRLLDGRRARVRAPSLRRGIRCRGAGPSRTGWPRPGRRARSASTARRLRRAARGRSTWCGAASSAMSTPSFTGTRSSANDASPSTSLANKSAKFRFRGVSAHAAGAPDQGRSALDGVEAMNHMVNLMREHVPQETRIHYVITAGGSAPNVVPDFAEVYYYVPQPGRGGGAGDLRAGRAGGGGGGPGDGDEHGVRGDPRAVRHAGQ